MFVQTAGQTSIPGAIHTQRVMCLIPGPVTRGFLVLDVVLSVLNKAPETEGKWPKPHGLKLVALHQPLPAELPSKGSISVHPGLAGPNP